MTVDWSELARRLGATRVSGEHSGTKLACAALEEIVGPEVFRGAVDHYVALAPGMELARSVLWRVHPWSGMLRCHDLYLTSEDLEVRRSAIELLRVVADGRALPWVPGYLADSDDMIQCWAAGIVDQLLFSDLVEVNECKALLDTMAEHANPKVRERHAFIAEFLQMREQRA